MRKVFIFDFDGTFYSGIHKYDNVRFAINSNKRKFLEKISDEDYCKICRENPKWLTVIMGNDIVKYLYYFKNKYPKLEISTKEFYDWQNNSRYDIIIDYDQIVDVSFIEELCKKYSVYVVSNSSPTHVSFYMKKININRNWFKGVYSNEFIEVDPTKEHYYEEILSKEKISSHNVYVFGDSVQADLAPALHLGCNAFYVNNAKNIKQLVNSILNNDM